MRIGTWARIKRQENLNWIDKFKFLDVEYKNAKSANNAKSVKTN